MNEMCTMNDDYWRIRFLFVSDKYEEDTVTFLCECKRMSFPGDGGWRRFIDTSPDSLLEISLKQIWRQFEGKLQTPKLLAEMTYNLAFLLKTVAYKNELYQIPGCFEHLYPGSEN